MDIHEVRMIAYEVLRGSINGKYCPVCKGTTTMVRVAFDPEVENLEVEEVSDRWRCMVCNNLLAERMEKV